MYKKLERSKVFIKDLQKVNFSNGHYSKYVVYLSKLISSEQLPSEALDHPLRGDYVGYREFHISGDLLVIYKITDDTIYLVRIGSHSQLFR